MDEERKKILDMVAERKITVEEAAPALRRRGDESTEVESDEAEGQQAEAIIRETEEEPKEIPTRRERMLALAERFRGWSAQEMASPFTTEERRPWPWPKERWQWIWQNFEYPVHVDQEFDLSDGSELSVVAYQGDVNVCGWEESSLKVSTAAFDLRIGRDENAVRIASSTGQLALHVPDAISCIEAKILPGDMLLTDIHAQKVEVECQSGDLRCEGIQGNLKARIQGGDVQLFRIEGDIDVTAARGSIQVQDVRSSQMNLKASGAISLILGPVDRGSYRCETHGADINLWLAEGSACELSAEATDGGRICPTDLSWTALSERSEHTLKATLKGGGASIELLAKGGRIHIRKSRPFPQR